MRKLTTTLISLCAGTFGMMASTYTVCDFENYEIGHTFTIWNTWGAKSNTTAVVEADPQNARNKVLHIANKSWNDHIEFLLPAELSGANFSEKVENLSLRICRHQNDPCGEWKNFQIYLGDEKLHEESFPSYGPVSTWKTWTYDIPAVSDSNTSSVLRLGFNSDNSDYYIDDICLKCHDFTVYEDGVLNFSNPSSTSSSYTYFEDGINIPEGTELNVYTSRYTYWMSDMIGTGRLNVYGGGERSFLGTEKGASHPDWTGYTGDIHIYPYPEVNTGVKAGFYGLVLAHGGKKFDSDNIAQSVAKRNITSIWENNTVTIHDGATIAADSNNTARGYRIGTLKTEKGSTLTGYYKNSAYRVYYLVGCSDADSELAGDIKPSGDNAKVGVIKEGAGTYRITGNNNNINGVLSVMSGRVLIDNDADEARVNRLSGAIGIGSNSAAAVVVYPDAVLGGCGNISGLTDVYGTIEPGSDSPATLWVADFVKSNKIDLRLRPTSRMRLKIDSAESHDCIDISGNLVYNNININLQTSTQLPVLELSVADNHNLHEGDRITLVKASAKSSLDGGDWAYRVQYPRVCTWKVEEETTADGYALVATVVSLDYSGQGDEIITIDPEDGADSENYYVDYVTDFSDPASLRYYADKMNKHIGVAASTWRYDIGDTSSPRVRTIGEQFNMIVAENEMKFDATEPERGHFDYTGGDRIIELAEANSMYVRGHTLVWHSQCPAWVSSDGKKNNHNYSREELLSIMENHITNVAGHYKGKVNEWDVVNEMLDDDQSIVRNNPDGYTLRTSVWHTGIGSDFIEKALEYAHAADSEAKLFINEYGAEFIGEPKSEALYNLAKYLVGKGAPLHGVGLQCHLTTGEVKADKLAANIRRYQELGLECIVTELDIAQAKPDASDAAEVQAAEYGALVNAALSQSNCPSVLIWGLADSDSWRENNPLLYDASVNPKDAYYAVHAALRVRSGNSTGIEETFSEPADVIRTEYYNIHGIRLNTPVPGLVIKREYHSDGTVTNTKVIIR